MIVIMKPEGAPRTESLHDHGMGPAGGMVGLGWKGWMAGLGDRRAGGRAALAAVVFGSPIPADNSLGNDGPK